MSPQLNCLLWSRLRCLPACAQAQLPSPTSFWGPKKLQQRVGVWDEVNIHVVPSLDRYHNSTAEVNVAFFSFRLRWLQGEKFKSTILCQELRKRTSRTTNMQKSIEKEKGEKLGFLFSEFWNIFFQKYRRFNYWANIGELPPPERRGNFRLDFQNRGEVLLIIM